MNFNFIAGNNLELNSFQDIESLVNNYPDFQSVNLANENELALLLALIGVNEYEVYDLTNPDFSKYWDLTPSKFPEFNKEQFDQFYENWLNKSGRKNNMDEYGNILFLHGICPKWNKLGGRFIVKERS